MRAAAAAEKAGVPSVSIIGSEFMKQASVIAKGLGLPFAVAQYRGAPMVDSASTVRTKAVEDLLPAIIEGLTSSANRVGAKSDAEPAPGAAVFKGTLDEVHEHFHRQMWSDGLPFIPPTRRRVEAFLRYTPSPWRWSSGCLNHSSSWRCGRTSTAPS